MVSIQWIDAREDFATVILADISGKAIYKSQHLVDAGSRAIKFSIAEHFTLYSYIMVRKCYKAKWSNRISAICRIAFLGKKTHSEYSVDQNSFQYQLLLSILNYIDAENVVGLLSKRKKPFRFFV